MGRFTTFRVLAFVGAAFALLSSCRAENPNRLKESVQAEPERLWYGSDGSKEVCKPIDAKCTTFKDEKEFVDLCVEKGHQAKTCGCSMRCSEAIDYVAKAEPAPAGAALTAGTCPQEKLNEINNILNLRSPGGALDRCLEAHVCSGVLGGCADAELRASTRLRELARAGCATEVVGLTCKNVVTDSLRCGESDIALLSKTWSDFHNKDVAIKRCIRKLVCSDDKGGCQVEVLRQATAIKNAVSRDGCDYWLRQFCSLGENW